MTEYSKKSPPQTRKMIRVSLDQQIVEAYEGSRQIFRFECVTGDMSHPTDRGVFTVFDKKHPYRSHAYNVQMNYAMFFASDGKALHQYHGVIPLSAVRIARDNVSDWFGSHGCVRLTEVDARTLYDWTPRGTTVHVA